MSVIDAVVLFATVALAITLVASPRIGRRVAPFALPVLIIGALLLWVLEGYWHWWPLYLLLALMFAFVVTDVAGTRRRAWFRAGIGVLAVVSMLPWAVPPSPELPEPTGPYAVGSEIFRWVDERRPEPVTAAEDRRNVVVQAWYPTELTSGRQWVYLDGQDSLPSRVSGIPGFLLSDTIIDTHATADVPVSPARERWPVVLFSPGYGAPRAFYSGLVADLASRGFVVLAIDHPYESAVTELADGTVATTVENIAADDPDAIRYMTECLETRTADLRFVLDQLARPEVLGPLEDRVDLGNATAIGHSLGGAAALSALAADPRLTAAANLDGTLYGDLPERALDRPALLLESDHEVTGHSQRYLDGNRGVLERLRAPGFRYEFGDADHFGFTDVPRFLAAPVRFVVTRFAGGSRPAADTQRTANDILTPFLLGRTAEVAAAAADHAGVTGGPVPR
ncbi:MULTISPECIES: alpha/beta hydrolase family protein [unclassified Nocardia]|uniref:alpha/beta hydrolase family protein n=1 Tax=unclassified Nocardia TaxID=2637762 RepID=UPI0033BA69EC